MLSKLAEGGMGSVYLGESAGRLAAVKTVHPQIAHSANGSQRFRREYEAAQLVASPYVASVIEADLGGPTPFLAIEYIEGSTLHDTVQRDGPLQGHELVRFGRHLATGLRAIHEAGVTHRDLKPSNVIMTPNGPVIIDFGIAMIEGDGDLTATNQIVGSPGWMSPEHVGGGQIGPPSDVFGWGGLVHFAATSENPFGTGNSQALMYRIAHGTAQPHTIANPVGDLCTAALQRHPTQRPTVDELLDGLDPALVPGPDTAAKHHRPQRRHLQVAAVVALAAVFLAVAAASAGWFTTTREPNPEAPVSEARGSEPAAEQSVDPAPIEAAPADPDGTSPEATPSGAAALRSSSTDTSSADLGPAAPNAIRVDCDAGSIRRLSDIDVDQVTPGTNIELKRGCVFAEPFLIAASGTADEPILMSAFGDPDDPVPTITNPEDQPGFTGGLLDLDGSHIEVRDLAFVVRPAEFHDGCATTPRGWIVGVQMTSGSTGNRVENTTFTGTHAGVYIDFGSNGHSIISNTFAANTMMNDISGAFGVQIFGDQNLIKGNVFSGHAACHPEFTVEAGAAINLFDGQDNVITENRSFDDRVFIAINGGRDQNPSGNLIHRNVVISDHTHGSLLSMELDGLDGNPIRITHNTAVLRGSNAVGVWCGRCLNDEITFANNIIWSLRGRSKRDADAAYAGGSNLFWNDDGAPSLAPMDLVGEADLIADPSFVDLAAGDLRLAACSPALGRAVILVGASASGDAAITPEGDGLDIGAFESSEVGCG